MENGITGYDFLEIIENGGDILRDELGIEKSSFINKIVKRIQARMLGIGSVPGSPKQFEHKFVSCKTVSFSWSRCTARVFPVHSYRIQRREINLFEHASTNNDNYSGLNLDMSLSLVSQPLPSDWKTVYVGGENEFVDSSLKMGHNYMYRIQAWNSVGRSGWETIDLTQILKKQRCSTKPHHSMMQSGTQSPRNVNFVDVDQWELLSIPKRLISGIIILFQLMFSFVRGFFAVIAMGTAIMRYRRASATSSASATTILPFPWFWTGINRLSVKITGNECIPRTMLGDKEALKRQETLHDERVGATGLRGYAQAKKKTSQCDDNEAETSNSSGRRNANRDSFDKRLEFGRQKSNSTGNLLSIAEVRSPFEGPRNFFTNTRQRRLRTLETVSSLSGGEVDSESVGKSNSQGSFESLLNSKSDHQTLSRCRSDIDDGFRCIECEKKFKFGKRWKHHCSRCMSTFCHKHGRTTHNNLTSCKVPGSCLCNPCLKLLKTRDHSSRQKGSDFTL